MDFVYLVTDNQVASGRMERVGRVQNLSLGRAEL